MIKGIVFNPDFVLEMFRKGTEIKTHDGRILTVVEGIPSNYMEIVNPSKWVSVMGQFIFTIGRE